MTGLLLLAGATLLGCSAREKAFCDKVFQCTGGTETNRDACVESLLADEQVARAYGCGDRWETLAQCAERSGTCKDRKYQIDCASASSALDSCEKAASVRGSSHFLRSSD